MIDLPHEISAQDYAGQGVDSDREMIALNRQAISFARAAVEDYDISRAYFDPAGKVNGAASAKADALNRSYAKHLESLGEPSEMLDAKSMFELTGSRHYVSGLFTPGTTMLQPAAYVRALASGLRRDGVAVYENAPVLNFESENAGWGRMEAWGQPQAARHEGSRPTCESWHCNRLLLSLPSLFYLTQQRPWCHVWQ